MKYKKEYDFSELRLLHFMAPNLDSLECSEDKIATEKFKKLFIKYNT
jgi:hypothetical protein